MSVNLVGFDWGFHNLSVVFSGSTISVVDNVPMGLFGNPLDDVRKRAKGSFSRSGFHLKERAENHFNRAEPDRSTVLSSDKHGTHIFRSALWQRRAMTGTKPIKAGKVQVI